MRDSDQTKHSGRTTYMFVWLGDRSQFAHGGPKAYDKVR
jgi:hypothetical protein